jgi:hypothetical protein
VRAWWAYWLTFGVGVTVWITATLVAGRGGLNGLLQDPLWLAVLVAPIAAAGLNLIFFRKSHEEVCRLEIQRHPWMRYVAGRG